MYSFTIYIFVGDIAQHTGNQEAMPNFGKTFLTIMFLRQLSSTGIIWIVCVYCIVLWRVWVVKDRCFQQCTFEGVNAVRWIDVQTNYIMASKGCQQLCYVSKIFDELVVLSTSPKNGLTWLTFLGGFISWIAAVLEGSGLMPVLLRTWPKYWISMTKKLHLLNFMVNCASQSLWKTCCKWSRCAFAVLVYITMSYK